MINVNEVKAAQCTPSDQQAVIEGVRAAANEESDTAANVDLALGALAFANDMSPDATESVFAISRTAGWIAHVLEEYSEAPLRFRARAIYDGEGETACLPGDRLSVTPPA